MNKIETKNPCLSQNMSPSELCATRQKSEDIHQKIP